MKHVPDQLDASLARLGNELSHKRDGIHRAVASADWATVARIAGEASTTQGELDRALSLKFERVRAAMQIEKEAQRAESIARAQAARNANRRNEQ